VGYQTSAGRKIMMLVNGCRMRKKKAQGESYEDILREYPTLREEDIRAVIAYAAWLAHEEELQSLHTVPGE
jgi:hypothetical protein